MLKHVSVQRINKLSILRLYEQRMVKGNGALFKKIEKVSKLIF